MSALKPVVKLTPSPIKFLGKKYIEIAQSWVGTGAAFGGTATLGLLYFTDWKLVLQYVPYYNGKFKQEE